MNDITPIRWDGRDWYAGQHVRVAPNQARRCPGFAGVLIDLEPMGQWAILWYLPDDGVPMSTSIDAGELLLDYEEVTP